MRPLAALLLCLACGLGQFALAADEAKPAAPVQAAATETYDEASVRVLNREIVILRAPLFGVDPVDRARRTERRINQLLDQGGPGEITLMRQPQGNVLLIDDSLAIALTPQDADALQGETIEQLTERTQRALARAIAETKEARDHGRILRALWQSALVTVVFGLLLWLIWRGRRALAARTARMLQARTAGTPLQYMWVHTLARWLLHIVIWPVLVFLTYEWLTFVLTRFPQTRAWGEALGAYVVGVFADFGASVIEALPDLAIAIVIFLLARGVIAALRPMFDRVSWGYGENKWLDRDTAIPTRRLVSIGIWLFAIAMAYPYLPGAESAAFKGISVLVGVMVTLGGSNLIGQGASGLILMYSRTLRVGEYVRINDQEGTVIEMGAFTTKIRTGLGEEISVPNALVLGTTTKNYSRAVKGDGYVVDTTVTIGYDTPWRQVEAMLTEAAKRTPGVLEEPPPTVFQTALSDFYIEYRLVCQAVPEEPRPRAEVLHALHANILDVFNEQGVQIMSPHYLGDPARPKIVTGQRPPDPASKPDDVKS